MADTEKIYDAGAAQRVTLALLQGDSQIEVAHLLNAATDDQLLIYMNAGYSSNEDEAFAAGVELWNALITGAEGYVDEAGNEPGKDALIENVDQQDKFFAIENVLLATRLLPLSKGSADKKFVLGNHNSAGSTFKLGVFNNGDETVTTHILRRPTTEEYRRGQAWQAERALGMARAGILVSLYDQMKVSNKGYAGNRVPAHHKAIVVLAHLTRQQQIVMGK